MSPATSQSPEAIIAWSLVWKYINEHPSPQAAAIAVDIRQRQELGTISPLGALLYFERQIRGMSLSDAHDFLREQLPHDTGHLTRDGWYYIERRPSSKASPQTISQLWRALGWNPLWLKRINQENVAGELQMIADQNLPIADDRIQSIARRIAQNPQLEQVITKIEQLNAEQLNTVRLLVAAMLNGQR